MSVAIEELIRRARDESLPLEQQHAAFGELVTRYEEAAFAWSLQLIGDPEEARDVAQDAFLTAWRKLRELRNGAAFGAWLKRLIATQCHRRRRKIRPGEVPYDEALRATTECHLQRRERQRLLASAMAHLPESEHRVLVLFYFLGRTMDEISAMLAMPRGTVGKRLYSARLAIRRRLPNELREELLQLRPSPQFLQKVREGLFDEYTGDYRFPERPELVVRIAREDAFLVSYGAGQRNVLASLSDGTLATTAYDGEGRFQRDSGGRVVQFVYYEFGERLGVARKCGGRGMGDR